MSFDDRLEAAYGELTVVHHARKVGDYSDAIGRLSDVVVDLIIEIEKLRALSNGRNHS